MKRKNLFVLDEKDGKVIQLFAELGMPTNLAKTLMYVSQVDKCCSADIEKGANLRQPEVCIAMQELRNQGWVDIQSFKKKKGKGRPIHIYKATASMSQVLEEIELEKTKEIEAIKDNVLELKNIFNNR